MIVFTYTVIMIEIQKMVTSLLLFCVYNKYQMIFLYY